MTSFPPSRADFESMSRAELIAYADELNWVHSIDLGDGYVTRGHWGSGNPDLGRAMAEIDFSGKRVLDIGCWDGQYSFDAEQRGAREVHATDLISQRDHAAQPTFEVARAARGSSVIYHPNLSVYEIEDLGIADFDIVIFAGVYYHLKDPLLALALLRKVTKTDGVILVEGAVTEEPGCFARFYYSEPYLGDTSNWWIPTVECLRQWIECSRFEIVADYGWGFGSPNPRLVAIGRAVVGADPSYKYPDEHLAGFMD